jgi:hypothetical protein
MLSTPALVRESDANTNPASIMVATQYVMAKPVDGKRVEP